MTLHTRPAWSGGVLAVTVLLVLGCQADDEPAAGPEPERATGTRPTPEDETSSPPSPSPSPPLLLPNMRSLPAEDLEVREAEDGRELRFSASLANDGDGPLVLVPDEEAECPEGERHASQVVYRDVDGDGAFDPDTDTEADEYPAGCMLFHPDHDHWHFDASARYELFREGEQDPVASSEKVSFCMRDSRRLRGERWEDVPETYEECERDELQGISAGWVDVYDADLEGQALGLSSDADGIYCLRLTADPFDLLQETDDEDNSAVIAVELDGDEATPVPDSDGACAP